MHWIQTWLSFLFAKCSINKQREITALDRQGTQQQRPESPTVTPPGVRVNTRYINFTKGTSSTRDAPSGINTFHFRHTRPLGASFLRTYLWWSLCTWYLLACQVELLEAIQVFVVVWLVFRALLFPFVCWFYISAPGLIVFQIAKRSASKVGSGIKLNRLKRKMYS